MTRVPRAVVAGVVVGLALALLATGLLSRLSSGGTRHARAPAQRVQVSKAPGQPAVYTITLAGGGTLQSYADPGRSGRNQVHFTFFGADGNEQPVGKIEATARPLSGDPVRLKVLRLGAGHFAANTDLTAGRWTFAVDAEPRGGAVANASFEQVIEN